MSQSLRVLVKGTRTQKLIILKKKNLIASWRCRTLNLNAKWSTNFHFTTQNYAQNTRLYMKLLCDLVLTCCSRQFTVMYSIRIIELSTFRFNIIQIYALKNKIHVYKLALWDAEHRHYEKINVLSLSSINHVFIQIELHPPSSSYYSFYRGKHKTNSM